MKIDLYEMKRRLFTWCKVLLSIKLLTSGILLADTIYVNPTDINCGGSSPCYATIQEAVEVASIGDTVFLQNGTYMPNTLHGVVIDKSIVLKGESEAGVIIDAGNVSVFGIYVQAEDVLLTQFTIENAPSYGIVNLEDTADGLTISDVTAKNNGKSGIGIRKLVGGMFKNLTLINNKGNGLSLTSVRNSVVENIFTSGNQFTGMDGYTAGIGIFSTEEDSVSSNIVFKGEFLVSEPVCIYVEPGPLTGQAVENPPVVIDSITVSDSLNVVVGIDVPLIDNKAQPDEDFGNPDMGADAVYYFKTLATASEYAQIAARVTVDEDSIGATGGTGGILEPFIFIYDIENDTTYRLPRITVNPKDVKYGCVGHVRFSVEIDSTSTNPSGFWEISEDNGVSWEPLMPGAPYIGVDSTTLTIDSVFKELDGVRYRYIAQGFVEDFLLGADTSAAAKLTAPLECFQCVEPPSIHCPVDTVVQCDSNIVPDPHLYGIATAFSNCDTTGIDTLFFSDTDLRGNDCFTGHYIRTWFAVDNLGNIDSCEQIFTYVDTVGPVLFIAGTDTLPADTNYYNCYPEIADSPQLQAVDGCTGDTPVISTADTVASQCDDNYRIIRTWVATDACGNETIHSQTIRVICNTEVEACELLDWDDPANPFSHSIYLYNSPLDPFLTSGIDTEAQRFLWDDSDPDHKPEFLILPGKDTAVVSGIVKSRLDETAKFEVMLVLVNPISGKDFTGTFVADRQEALEAAEDNVQDWTLWMLSDMSKLIGRGSIEGILSLTHAPADFSKRAQVGIGGNGKDADLGIACWFFYKGDLLYDGKEISLDSQGDINADIGECETFCDFELPTIVNQLDGTLLNNSYVQLSWGTYAEGPNMLILERSLDGQLFTQVDTVQGQNNALTAGSGSINDEDAAGSDVLYYRLKVMRPDGSFVYTNTVAVYVGDPDKHLYMMYPNPVDEDVYVRAINPLDGTHFYQVIDLAGRTVKREELDATRIFRIELNSLSPGYYFLRIERPDGKYEIMRMSVRH